ncbi:MAG: hypothetical protein KJO07_04680 [Deltaproteobacteria bacterium]|nr:hypothetical protein [Deltaproteobacteria bacterium]
MTKLKVAPLLALVFALGACKKEEAGQKTKADYPEKPRASEVQGQAGAGRTAVDPARTPVHGGSAPHAGMGQPPNAAQTSPGPGPADIGGLEVTIPNTWKPEPLKSRMRAAQYAIGAGAARVEVAVFYFQKRGAGDVASNFERWKKQFSKLDGEPKVSDKMVGQMKAHRIDMTGTFGGGPPMRPMAAKQGPRDGTRMVGAIVEAPAGPYYFKMIGPKAEVDKATDGFDDMIASAKPSPL